MEIIQKSLILQEKKRASFAVKWFEFLRQKSTLQTTLSSVKIDIFDDFLNSLGLYYAFMVPSIFLPSYNKL